LGQRTSALGVGDADGDLVGLAVALGEESSRPVGADVGADALPAWREPLAKTAAATTAVSTTASTPMITASRRFRGKP
jgi:hypothetical protein